MKIPMATKLKSQMVIYYEELRAIKPHDPSLSGSARSHEKLP